MAYPTLTPSSRTSVSRLPVTGTVANVNSVDNPLPYGVYIDHAPNQSSLSAFKEGAADQVTYVYKKLGGDVLDIEITEYQVYSAYEEACLEYSYLVNVHQAKNVLGSLLGAGTGSFDSDGELLEGDSLSGSEVALKYPKFSFQHILKVGDSVSTEIGIGGTTPIYSASFDTTVSKQDYDLQDIISTTSTTDSDSPFYQKLGSTGDKRVTVRKVYYKTPNAMWRFYGYYGGLNTVGNLSYYGQYSDDSTFELIPTWQNKSQAMAFEDAIYTRASHFSYEIKDNKLRIFPSPVTGSPTKMWVEFSVETDPWTEEAGKEDGAAGINNMNTLPFENIPYDKINSIGKQWIRRFALALSKEMLGLIRSKFASIPIPNESVTLNGPALVSEAKEEQQALRDELKTVLDELTYEKLAEKDSNISDSSQNVLKNIPPSVYVG
mgnify:CR=1 FL=1|tara:strand:- start:13066 stop:14367 length:1302 start_codon:yes stop_codon:yes gene_type:complete